MKFFIENIVLWQKNGTKRTLTFLNNKVNIITGESNTGKTAILQIIDYCFFSSKSKISESIINENVDWYGIRVNINDKRYTIARKSLHEGKVSEDYFFSSTGELPDQIKENNNSIAIKKILETEFSINGNVTVSYGSKSIKAGSKISLRYLLMFNTISVNIIENDSDIFFDKQNESRYRDALPRIFDIAVGIDTLDNQLKKDKKLVLEKKIAVLKKKKQSIINGSDEFEKEKKDIVKTAKEYSLVDNSLDLVNSLIQLEKVISNFSKERVRNPINFEYEQIEKDINIRQLKITNLEKFTKEYSNYKKQLKNIQDSLVPIQFLKKRDDEIIKTSIFDDILTSFENQLSKIKTAIKAKNPIDNQVTDQICELRIEIENLKSELNQLPVNSRFFETEKDEIFFLGQTKTKLELYLKKGIFDLDKINSNIKTLEDELLKIVIIDIAEKKELTIKLIEEVISEYIEYVDQALENYKNYKPVFDYKEKSLKLRKPKTAYIEPVGSSSNHMFLHLFFSLSMHEICFKNNSPFIAPFLIIDQPSRPYYGDESHKKLKIDHSDEFKITKAFELLNKYMDERINNEGEFQMIVLEHIPTRLIDNLDYVHVVEEFRNGNALINSLT